jgi:large subunit ribosomal protein L21
LRGRHRSDIDQPRPSRSFDAAAPIGYHLRPSSSKEFAVYAVIEDRGTQIKVSQGDVVEIDVMSAADAKDGKQPSKITFDKVLLLADGAGKNTIGTPYVKGASVTADVVDQIKGEKTVAVMYKRRKGQKKKSGHRQPYLRVKITAIKS